MLRENHSGMETGSDEKGLHKKVLLRENHSGMESFMSELVEEAVGVA